MEADAESLHMQSTFMIEVLQNKYDKTVDDKFPRESNDCLDVSENTDVEKNGHNKLPKNNQNDSNKFQERTCNRTSDEVLRKESISEKVEILPEESTSNCKQSSEENNVQIVFNQSAVSSGSSSDEEVLQTRFILQNDKMIYEDDHNSNNSPISSERISDKDSIPENDSEIKKTSPIIIQAIACADDSVNFDSDNIKLNSELKQTEINDYVEITKTDMASDNCLSVEADNSEIKTSYKQNSTENDNEFLDSNNRMDRNEVFQQEMTKHVTRMNGNDSSILDFGASNDISAELIQDFLHGSFDLSAYQSERSSRNIMGKSIASERKQSAKSKPSSNTMQKNREDILENNKYNKEKYGLFTAPNEAKQNNLNKSKNDFFENSYDVAMKSLKRKKPRRQIKDTKKAGITVGRKSSKDVNITPGRNKKSNFKSFSKLENKFSHVKGQREHKNNIFNHDENKTILNFNTKNEDTRKNKKSNTAKRNNYKEENMSDALLCNDSPFRNSRNKRNSSLIASRKIKEIEMLENFDSYEEICLDFDEKNTNSDDACFTSYNVNKNGDKYTDMLEFGKIHNNYRSENKLKSDNFWNKNISDVVSDSFQSYSAKQEKMENSRVTRSSTKYKKMFKDAFDACRITVRAPLMDDDKEITNKYFTSDTNLPDDCFIQGNEDLYENPSSSRKEVNKREHNKNNKSIKNKMPDTRKNTVDKNASQKCNVQSIITYKGAITRSKQKTWDMLEKELLGELDDAPLTNDVCKTIILQKEKLVRKRNIKDANLYTVSNRSMMQTINKSKRGNEYNMQYELRNTKSKYLKTKANNAQNYLNTFNNTQPEEISSIPKNTTILERTIAAMERCTAQFIEPQVNVIENEQKWDTFQFEDEFNNSDVNQETQFHSNIMTFMENEHYYKNEIVGYLKKSTRRKKSINYKEKYKIVNNFSDGDGEYGNSNDTQHLEKSSLVTKNYFLENNAEENLKDQSKALVSLSGEKHINPWDRLMGKLNLEQNNEDNAHIKEIFNNEKIIKKSSQHTNNLKRRINTHLNRNDNILATVGLDKEEINKQDKMNDIQCEEVSKLMPNKEKELPVNHMPAYTNSDLADNYTLNSDFGSRKNSNKRSKSDTDCVIKNLEIPMEKMKKNESKVTKIQKVRGSPKFKLQIVKDGSLKIKRHSSRSSSVTNSSEEFAQLKQNNIKHLKSNDHPKDKSSKAREKYKKYLKNLFNREDKLLKEGLTSDHNKIKPIEAESKNKENFIKEKRKRKLIAEDNEDIFSLSSSDSEVDNDKNRRLGLLSEVFDE